MRLTNYINLCGEKGYAGLFFACGSFGIVDGDANYIYAKSNNTETYTYDDGKVKLTAVFEHRHGVIIRRDTFTNLTDGELEINALSSRFTLDGNAYEIYTQYNGWQHESSGGWQKLVTQISARSEGIRTCDGAAPIMGFHNLYTGKNTVFHLMPNAKWHMTAKKFPEGAKEFAVFEAGLCERGLRLDVMPNETIELPTVIFYNAESKTDLDAHKLHRVYNELYPRKTLPVLYNSWLYCFDKLDIDALKRQADCAADMGFEAFMIDAGWFGKGECDWWNSVGDWAENMTGGPKGRLLELSEHVRQCGMIFGLWFEPERASRDSNAVKVHPEYYINKKFLDFANPDAVDYILGVLSEQIDKYKIGWLKFDFNATLPTDPSGRSFYRYMQGQKNFVLRLREKHPELYITNCASGGQRMDLWQGTLFDSFWFSDNQGPYEGVRIVKDTLKRMPTALIERWNVQKYCEGFPNISGGTIGRMINCNNGTWDSLIGVNDSFVEEFMMGGIIGFSCDICAFPEEYKARWKECIAKHKENRDFYGNASARIIVDSDAVTAIEYSDTKLQRCVVQVFTRTVYADSLVIYPEVDVTADYRFDDEIINGNDIKENGIPVENLRDNSCRVLELKKIAE